MHHLDPKLIQTMVELENTKAKLARAHTAILGLMDRQEIFNEAFKDLIQMAASAMEEANNRGADIEVEKELSDYNDLVPVIAHMVDTYRLMFKPDGE